jgi:Tfp pilus assembly protein FimT
MTSAVKSRRPRTTGVTLIELLLCVGLISVITALAMPFYSNAESAREAKDRRNAQTFCSVYAIAQAAGVTVPTAGSGDTKMQILGALREGVTVHSGPLRGRTLQVSNIQDAEMAAAARFLRYQQGQLVFDSNNQDG